MKTKQKLSWMFVFSILSVMLIGLFWLIWFSVTRSNPQITQIKMTEGWILQLPVQIPRHWDILIGPIWSIVLVSVFTHKRVHQKEDLAALLIMSVLGGLFLTQITGLVLGMILTLLLGLVISFTYGIIHGVTVVVSIGLTYSLTVLGIVPGLFVTIILGENCALIFLGMICLMGYISFPRTSLM